MQERLSEGLFIKENCFIHYGGQGQNGKVESASGWQQFEVDLWPTLSSFLLFTSFIASRLMNLNTFCSILSAPILRFADWISSPYKILIKIFIAEPLVWNQLIPMSSVRKKVGLVLSTSLALSQFCKILFNSIVLYEFQIIPFQGRISIKVQ